MLLKERDQEIRAVSRKSRKSQWKFAVALFTQRCSREKLVEIRDGLSQNCVRGKSEHLASLQALGSVTKQVDVGCQHLRAEMTNAIACKLNALVPFVILAVECHRERDFVIRPPNKRTVHGRVGSF